MSGTGESTETFAPEEGQAAVDRLAEELRIEGWCRPAERALLYALARSGPGSGAIVEVGTWQGLSTLYLAAGSKRAGREPVTTIDPFPGDNYAILAEHLRRAQLTEWVDVVQMYSMAAARKWDGRPIRLLYLDGDHAYEQVLADFQAWQSFVAPGGIVAFHDALEPQWPGVSQALDALLLSGEWGSFRIAHRAQTPHPDADSADPLVSSIVVAQRIGGTGALDSTPTIGQGPFVVIRDLYAQLRAQRATFINALAEGRATEQAAEAIASAALQPPPPVAEEEPERLEGQIRALEGQYHQAAQYARDLEEHLAQLQQALARAQQEHERLADTNRQLGGALRAANPVKHWLRERLGRGGKSRG